MNSPFIMSLWAAGNLKHISKANRRNENGEADEGKAWMERHRQRNDRERWASRDGKSCNGKMVKTQRCEHSARVNGEFVLLQKGKSVEVFVAVQTFHFFSLGFSFRDFGVASHPISCATGKMSTSSTEDACDEPTWDRLDVRVPFVCVCVLRWRLAHGKIKWIFYHTTCIPFQAGDSETHEAQKICQQLWARCAHLRRCLRALPEIVFPMLARAPHVVRKPT